MHDKLLNFNSKHHNTNLYRIRFILFTSRTNMQMHKVPSPGNDLLNKTSHSKQKSIYFVFIKNHFSMVNFL